MSAAASFSSLLTCKSSSSLFTWKSSSSPMACRPSNNPHRVRPLSLKAAAAAACGPSNSPFPASPWLILGTVYAVYSRAEDRVFDLNKGKDWPMIEEKIVVPPSNKDVYNQTDHWGINPVDLTSVDISKFGGPQHSWKENEDGEFLSRRCVQELHLVYSHSLSRLPLVVVRFIEMTHGGYGSSVVGFALLEIDGMIKGTS